MLTLRKLAAAGVMCVVAAKLASCAKGPEPAPKLAQSAGFSALEAPPSISAAAPEDLGDASAAAARLGESVARDGRPIEVSAAPFLYASPIGRRFLAAPAPRALARGEPAERCPTLGLASGGSGGDVVRRALSACLAQTTALGLEDCGCRVLAVDAVVAAPPEAFAYAPGVSARLIGATALESRPLVAEEAAAPEGGGLRVVFRDLSGPVAAADLSEDGAARLILLGADAVYEGRRERIGWRRGRLAERLLLTGPGGERLIAVIGVEPQEFAGAAASLSRWPGGA